jgi:hypothetical protein
LLRWFNVRGRGSIARSAAIEPASANFEPTGASEEILGAPDEGVILDAASEPVRRVRIVSVERRTWADSATGAQLEVELPREDVFLTSLAIQ